MTGNPIFRFRLIHDIEGTFEINEPIGWLDSKLILERDQEYSSLIERYEGAFAFYGSNGQVDGGINVIRFIEDNYGLDADLIVEISVSFDDGDSFEQIFSGLYDFSENEENNLNQIQSAIIRDGFWTKFINRTETPVDLQSSTGMDGSPVDVIAPLTVELTSQIIPRTTSYNGDIFASDPSAPVFEMPFGGAIDANGSSDDFDFFSAGTIELDQDEIEESFSQILDFVTTFDDVTPQIELPNEGGDIDVTIELAANHEMVLHGEIFASSSEADPSVINSIRLTGEFYIQKNDEIPTLLGGDSELLSGVSTPSPGLPVSFTRVFNFGLVSSPLQTTITMVPSDRIKVFIKWTISFDINVGADTGVIKWSSRDITMQRFAPRVTFSIGSTYNNTDTPAFFIHDAARSIIDRITDQNSSLTSPALGNTFTSPAYESSACDSRYVVTRGLQIRQYSLSDKPMQMSWKQWWSGAHPILNLGLGYTSDNKIEIGKREDFFDEDAIVQFDYVSDIIRRYDQDVIFNKVEIGFQKWQSENISGLDDPQTKHSYATRFKKVGKPISILSDWIAASLAIENTRRATQKKSLDYKFDDDTFIISLANTDAIGTDLSPETNGAFFSISGLKNPSTRYNIRLTPSRALAARWIKYLSGCLQDYTDSFFKFAAGEGNYEMSSDVGDGFCDYTQFDGPLSEKQDIPVSEEFIHLPDIFEIKVPLYWDQYVDIRNNRKKGIRISQTGANHTLFYIKQLDYDICHSKATILAWPKTKFHIEVVDFVQPVPYCQAPVDTGCGVLGRDTEDGFERITEDGQCREIE